VDRAVAAPRLAVLVNAGERDHAHAVIVIGGASYGDDGAILSGDGSDWFGHDVPLSGCVYGIVAELPAGVKH